MAQQVESKNRATSTEEARKDALKQIKDDGVEFLTTAWGSTARRSRVSTRSRSRT